MSAALEPPTMTDALVTGGALCHFIASDRRIAELFATWASHCPGDLDADTVVGYLAECHDLLSPECPDPIALGGPPLDFHGRPT
jgi:hypothetical protein